MDIVGFTDGAVNLLLVLLAETHESSVSNFVGLVRVPIICKAALEFNHIQKPVKSQVWILRLHTPTLP